MCSRSTTSHTRQILSPFTSTDSTYGLRMMSPIRIIKSSCYGFKMTPQACSPRRNSRKVGQDKVNFEREYPSMYSVRGLYLTHLAVVSLNSSAPISITPSATLGFPHLFLEPPQQVQMIPGSLSKRSTRSLLLLQPTCTRLKKWRKSHLI